MLEVADVGVAVLDDVVAVDAVGLLDDLQVEVALGQVVLDVLQDLRVRCHGGEHPQRCVGGAVLAVVAGRPRSPDQQAAQDEGEGDDRGDDDLAAALAAFGFEVGEGRAAAGRDGGGA